MEIKAEEEYKNFENIVNKVLEDINKGQMEVVDKRALSEDGPLWYALRYAGDVFIKNYNEDYLSQVAEAIEKLPEDKFPNKTLMAGSMKASIGMRHMVMTDASGKETPMKYEPLVK